MSINFLPLFSNCKKDPSKCCSVFLDDIPLEYFDLFNVSPKLNCCLEVLFSLVVGNLDLSSTPPPCEPYLA